MPQSVAHTQQTPRNTTKRLMSNTNRDYSHTHKPQNSPYTH